jgi:hypothetical protein
MHAVILLQTDTREYAAPMEEAGRLGLSRSDIQNKIVKIR